MLLNRNQPRKGIEVVYIHHEEEDRNPVPDWLMESPSPWNLVAFFKECLSRCIKDGQEKSLANGYKAELRPAKILLDTYGVEKSAQFILDKTSSLVDIDKFTLWRVVDYGKEIEKRVAKRGYAKRLQPISSDQEDGQRL